MNDLIAVVTYVVTGILGLLAFFGRAWKDNKRSKIHWHGTTLLILAICSIGLQIWKQVRVAASDKKAIADVTEARDRERKKQDELDTALRESRLNENKLLEQATQQREVAATANGKLEGMQSQVVDLKSTLGEERDENRLQSVGALVNALSTGNTQIREIQAFVPFTAKARKPSQMLDGFLPELPEGECKDLTGVQVSIWTPGDIIERFYLTAADKQLERQLGDSGSPKADGVIIAARGDEDDDLKSMAQYIGQHSINHAYYVAAVRPRDSHDRAAEMFSYLSIPGNEPLDIIVQWPAFYRNPTDFADAKRKHPEVISPDTRSISQNSNAEFPNKHEQNPPRCSNMEKQYLASAFSKASIIVELKNEVREEIMFDLTAEAPVNYGSGIWGIRFKSDGVPRIAASVNLPEFVKGPEDEKDQGVDLKTPSQ